MSYADPPNPGIRATLTRLLLTTITPLILAVGIAIFLIVRTSLVARFDDGLRSRAAALAAMLSPVAGGVDFDYKGETMPLYERPGSGEYFEVRATSAEYLGGLIERSQSLGDRSLPIPPLDGPYGANPTEATTRGLGPSSTSDAMLPPAASSIKSGPHDPAAADASGESIRLHLVIVSTGEPEDEEADDAPAAQRTLTETAFASAASPASQSPPVSRRVLIAVAQSRAELNFTLLLLGTTLAIAGVLLLSGIILAVHIVVAKGLSPLATLAAEVQAAGPDHPDLRITTTRLAAELLPVASRTNDLLARLAAALQRERRLAASAAHELRTPIAEVRTTAELMLLRDRSGGEYRQALTQIVATAQAMGRTVGGLLLLARISSDTEKPAQTPTDLCAHLETLWATHIAPLASEGIQLSLTISPAARTHHVAADPGLLDLLLENLLRNIAEYTPRPAGYAHSGSSSSSDPTPAPAPSITATISLRGPAAISLILTNTTELPAPPAPAPVHPPRSGHLGIGLQLAEAAATALRMQITHTRHPRDTTSHYRTDIVADVISK